MMLPIPSLHSHSYPGYQNDSDIIILGLKGVAGVNKARVEEIVIIFLKSEKNYEKI